jgi:thiamine pyrophosphokinase
MMEHTFKAGLTNPQQQPCKTACVVCNGVLSDTAEAYPVIHNSQLVIAADGGSKHLALLHVEPDVIVGDMDSLVPDTWPNVQRISYHMEKNKTDTELAVEYAFSQECQQVSLLAATGGRLDHTLGNIALVARYPGRVAILLEEATLVAADKTQKCLLHGAKGTIVSLIPFGTDPVTIRSEGLKYPLDDRPLTHPTHGLSNEMIGSEASIWVLTGVLLVYVERILKEFLQA